MGAWIFSVSVVALEPDRWLVQTRSGGFIRFDHGVEQVVGTHLLCDEDHVVLPALDTPMQDLTSLSNTDFSKCVMEVDIVGMNMSGTQRRHTLAVVPFQTQKYGHPANITQRIWISDPWRLLRVT